MIHCSLVRHRDDISKRRDLVWCLTVDIRTYCQSDPGYINSTFFIIVYMY